MARKKINDLGEEPNLLNEEDNYSEDIDQENNNEIESSISQNGDIIVIKEELFKELTTSKELGSPKLYNTTGKYKFQIENKYNKIYLSITKKYTSDFHVGTFIYNNIDEIKGDIKLKSYLQLVDIDKFLKSFKYK